MSPIEDVSAEGADKVKFASPDTVVPLPIAVVPCAPVRVSNTFPSVDVSPAIAESVTLASPDVVTPFILVVASIPVRLTTTSITTVRVPTLEVA